ncbi:MAG: squalene/phytoene synthase family protein [Verrucomicrobiota bacterium]
MKTPSPSAEAITRSSKSNFALAFLALPPERRKDLTTFYAFCRVIDDIADEPGPTPEAKARQLASWKRALCEASPDEPPLAAEVRTLMAKYHLKEALLRELIQGCEMDLTPTHYTTWEDLRRYCYRVASVVGLVSIEIFGYRNPATQRYAVELGYALQWTNILRDVAKDLANGGRIYLPLEDLARFGITPEDLALRQGGPRFAEFMAFAAERAEALYARARAELPPEDRPSLAAAEIMRRIYHRLLQKMRRDGFRVFEKQYRLGKLEKLALAARVLLFPSGLFGIRTRRVPRQ